ncbi:Protein timeless-like protein [Hypsibius exemplaris]|uniref:Protein timeless-like protein n=1 Tax=Hypsibius exemplaris TaxID=2072580 RepID=A0A1W0WHF2_HYPEX|nr:Protein timeless-like protein [Hypsibius exemplaris]
MERRSRPVPVVADPDRPLGEKLRTINATEVLEKPKLKDAWSLGDKLRRANPNLANKPKTNDHNKSEIAQLDLVKILKSIGTVVKGKYIQDPVCQLALKHMARHIREDRHNDKLTVRLHLVSAGVVETNLIPMLLATPADDKLWQLCLSVMYELTVPPAVILRTIPKDKVEDSPWLKIYLREYDDKRQAAKRLFVDVKFFELLCNHLKTILTAEERTREQTNFVGNALRLLRNIFEMRGETDRGVDRETPALIHDKVFCALDQSGIAAILLWLSSADEEEDFVLDVLEVIHALLYDFDPEAFGQTGKTEKELQESQRVIRDMRAREEAVRAASLLKASSRHSAFGGSFTVKGSKAVNPDNEIVLIRPVTAIMNNKFELTADKQAQAKAHNKKAMKSVVERKEAPAVVSEALRTFCTRFLNLSYNVFMQNAKAAIGYVPAEDADEQHSRYFWALRFFTAFARVHNVGVQFISETISTESFHFVHSKLEAYTDLIITDKTQIALWSNRSHLALRSYLELLMMLAAMGTNPDEKVQRAAKQIEINLFYVAEYREIFFKLLKSSKSPILPVRAYLKDLVITIHIFLKLLEVYLKKQHHLFVKKKQRAKKGAGRKRGRRSPKVRSCWPIQVDLFGSVGDSVDSDLKRLNKMLLDVLPDLIEELPEPEVLEVIEEGYDAGLDGSRQDIAEDETEADGSDGHKQEASDYPNNTFPVNHAILKMMHRIAVDLLLPACCSKCRLFGSTTGC